MEATVTSHGVSAQAAVPSGKSTGSHEARELRDPDGGVDTAVANVKGEIAEAICGHLFHSLDDLDYALIELDDTANKSRLGANALLAVSMAVQRLSATLNSVPLWSAISERAKTKPDTPRLYVNVMNGGVHVPSTPEGEFQLPFQEYLLVFEGPARETLTTAHTAFDELGEMLGPATPMGDEGGYAPTITELEKPFQILADISTKHQGTSIAIDAAANEFYRDGSYHIIGKDYSPDELLHIYEDLVGRYPLRSIEDPFMENANKDFAAITGALGNKALIVGDDFTVTHPLRIDNALHANEINAVLVKPNQIGTVLEAIQAVHETYAGGARVVASHRSGETMDTFIADFAYAVGAWGLKAGGLGQKERLVKYERLIAIEKEAANFGSDDTLF